jgi:tetratricopeptide (TPR) repeat protein
VWLGSLSGTGTFLNGSLDDVRLYNRSLTPSEIRLLASRRGIGILSHDTPAVLDRFLAQYFERHPVSATFTGLHTHDHRLPDWSRDARDTDVAALAELHDALFSAFPPKDDAALANDIDAVDAELARANEEYKTKIASLTTQLQQAGTSGKSDSTLAKENGMLRSILDRQLKEQARREAARRLVLDEFKNLAVSTDALKTQLEVLSSPLVSLTDEEQGMLKFSAPTLVAPEPAASAPAATPPLYSAAEKPTSPETFSEKPRIPDEFKDTAAQATSFYNQKKFDEAAAAYEKILAKYPQSIYALSNLGVVRFQQQKYPEAEKALREAIRVAPNDAFSHSVLGIALVQQEKYDDAIQILSRAVALDPADAKTRNYLGISSSRKGLQEAAEQECRKAIELDDGYGDAHFNLAVIYATQTPPAKELAKRHYTRALELGVPKDAELEKLIN